MDEVAAIDEGVSENSRRRRWVVVAVVLALGVGGYLIVDEQFGPDEAVERFLAAAQDRDVDTALDEVLPETLNSLNGQGSENVTDFDNRDAFLTEKAMRADWDYGSVSNDWGGETVTAEITGAGQTRTAEFKVSDTEVGWKLDDPFAYVEVPVTSLTYLDVNGMRVADPQPNHVDPRPSFPVFPGTYRFFEGLPDDVAVDKGSSKKLLAPESRTVEDSQYKPKLGKLSLTGGLRDDAIRSANGFLKSCAESDNSEPADPAFDQSCPFEVKYTFEVGGSVYKVSTRSSVEWKLTELPSFKLVDKRGKSADDAWAQAGFEAVVDQPGRLAVSGMMVGVGETTTELKYDFSCELAPHGLRSRLDENDTLNLHLHPYQYVESVEPINPDNESCDFDYEIV